MSELWLVDDQGEQVQGCAARRPRRRPDARLVLGRNDALTTPQLPSL